MGEIRIHGRGGQGAVVAAEILATAFVLEGKYAANFPFFGQERRGVPVAAFVRFGKEPVRERTRIYHPDIVLILDRVLARHPECYAGLKDGGMAILNTKEKEPLPPGIPNLGLWATVDATGISLEETGLPITNSCMLGAFARATQLLQLETLLCALEEFLKGEVLARNKKSMQRGFREAEVKFPERREILKRDFPVPSRSNETPKAVPFQSKYESAWADAGTPLTIPTGEWRFRTPLVQQEICRQCGWCQLYCPAGCRKLGENGYFQPDLTYCKGCGICAHECPAHAIRMVREEQEA